MNFGKVKMSWNGFPEITNYFDNQVFDVDLGTLSPNAVIDNIQKHLDKKPMKFLVEETLSEESKTTWSTDLPGVKTKDLEVYVENDTLCVKGLRAQKKFESSYTIPETHDPDTAVAWLQDGVLFVSIEKQQVAVVKHRSILVV